MLSKFPGKISQIRINDELDIEDQSDKEWGVRRFEQTIEDRDMELALAMELLSEKGARYRMGIRTTPANKYPFSPITLAYMLDTVSKKLKEMFNADGTLTEKGKIEMNIIDKE